MSRRHHMASHGIASQAKRKGQKKKLELEQEPVLKMNPRSQRWIVGAGAGVKSSGRRISMDDSKQQKWRAKNIASSVNQ